MDGWNALDEFASIPASSSPVLGVNEVYERDEKAVPVRCIPGSLKRRIHSLEVAIAAGNAEHLQREMEKAQEFWFRWYLFVAAFCGFWSWSGYFHLIVTVDAA